MLQLSVTIKKSPRLAPDRANGPSTRLAVPVLVNTTDCGTLLAPTVTEPNVKLLVESVAAGAAGAAPVPDNETLCGLPAALLLMATLADLVPVAVGLNDMLNEQLPFGTRVALLQVFVATK